MAFFSGLLNGYRRAFAPARHIMSDPWIGDAYDSTAEMVQRFRELQAEQERFRMRGRLHTLGNRTARVTGPFRVEPDYDYGTGNDLVLLASGGNQHDDERPAPPYASGRARVADSTAGNVDVEGDASRVRGGPAAQAILADVASKIGKPPDAPAPHISLDDPIWRAKLRRGEGLNGHEFLPSERDVNLFARALFTEFGNVDSWQDMRAGGSSIINRIRPQATMRSDRNELGRNLQEVLERRNPNGVPQYSFMPRGGINAPGGHPRWRLSANPSALTGDDRKAWELAVQSARALLGGTLNDPTGGAIFFRSRLAPEDDFWRSLRPSTYRSPRNENFFYLHPEETPQTLPQQNPVIGPESPRLSPKLRRKESRSG